MMGKSQQSKLPAAWTAHIKDPKEKEEFIKYIYSAHGLFEVLNNIVEKKILETSKSSSQDYEQAAWAYRQADKAGYIRALTEVTNLIKLENR